MKKGEIWLVELPSSNGHEQTGTRPAIILSEEITNIAIVIPLTSNTQALKFPYTIELKPTKRNGLLTNSVALIFHIRGIDKKRIIKNIGQVEEISLQEIERSIKRLLKI